MEGLVVIPTYNERANIGSMIRRVISLSEPLAVLVVDDASPDGTAQEVRQLILEYPERVFLLERAGKQGLGTAYVHGFTWALERGYCYIFEMDADFSHNPDDLVRLLRACRDGDPNLQPESASVQAKPPHDMAIGSRYVTGVNVVNWPMSRVLLSYFASVYVRAITGMPFRDATAGFICYHRRVLETILSEPVRFVGYAFQIEMKFRAWKYHFRMVEVPIIFTERAVGESKMTRGIFKEAVLGVVWLKLNSFFRNWQVPVRLEASPAVLNFTRSSLNA